MLNFVKKEKESFFRNITSPEWLTVLFSSEKNALRYLNILNKEKGSYFSFFETF